MNAKAARNARLVYILLGVYIVALVALQYGISLIERNPVVVQQMYYTSLGSVQVNLIPLRNTISLITGGNGGAAAAIVIGRIVSLLPLGILLPILHRGKRSAKGFAGSVVLLLLWSCLGKLTLDVDFVICTVVGLALGYLIWKCTICGKVDISQANLD